MQDRVLADGADVRLWLKRNLVCVITVAEHGSGRLPRDRHRNPEDPWLRYAKARIVLLYNQAWTAEEIEPLRRHGLLNADSFPK